MKGRKKVSYSCESKGIHVTTWYIYFHYNSVQEYID